MPVPSGTRAPLMSTRKLASLISSSGFSTWGSATSSVPTFNPPPALAPRKPGFWLRAVTPSDSWKAEPSTTVPASLMARNGFPAAP